MHPTERSSLLRAASGGGSGPQRSRNFKLKVTPPTDTWPLLHVAMRDGGDSVNSTTVAAAKPLMAQDVHLAAANLSPVMSPTPACVAS